MLDHTLGDSNRASREPESKPTEVQCTLFSATVGEVERLELVSSVDGMLRILRNGQAMERAVWPAYRMSSAVQYFRNTCARLAEQR